MKKFLKNGGLVLLGSVAAVSTANAAVATGVTTAITDSGTDAGVVGSGVLVVLVGIAAFKYIRKAL